MALKSPLLPSPNNSIMSAFSPYSDSPTSPQRFGSPINRPMSSDSQRHLQPPTYSSAFNPTSPSDIADPSPISTSSNDTDTTHIEDAPTEAEDNDPTPEPTIKATKPGLGLETKEAAAQASRPRSDEDEQPSSVIHAPQGFDAFHRQSPPSLRRSTPTPSQRSDILVLAPPEDSVGSGRRSGHSSVSPPPPLQTSLIPTRDWSTTPLAQTRAEMEQSLDHEIRKPSSRSSSRASSLADIPESQDGEQDPERTPNPSNNTFEQTVERLKEQDDEVAALNVALSECWTLCNTLAGLSYVHRERIFKFSGKRDQQEQAWKSCWKLCQKLYETRDEEIATQVRPTLDLCRDFCQCLFEVRRNQNEDTDSVLRVSFELNNHLYNTHDRSLPEAFRERTLDFYITLCHRLMKQRSELARETDSLLGACWSLAEMLFSLRQNKREGKPADEELLGSAVQACWELCDLFREGWTQIRPDRGTPRPSQTTFTQAFHQAKQSHTQSSRSPPISSHFFAEVPEMDESEDEDFGRQNPETPTTVFEDTQQISPDEGPVPNILVLGPSDQVSRASQRSNMQQARSQPKWSSSSSTRSGYSQGSKTSASSSSTINPNNNNSSRSQATSTQHQQQQQEDPHLTCLKLLLVKAATNIGFQRSSSSSSSSSSPSSSLAHFIKSVPSNSFGTKSWQLQLLDSYKKLVASEPGFFGGLGFGFEVGAPARRARAVDVARSVRWMVGSHGQYAWLRDLYRWVFGFHVEEGEGRGDVVIQS